MRLSIVIPLALNFYLSEQLAFKRLVATHSPAVDTPSLKNSSNSTQHASPHGYWDPHTTPYPLTRRDSNVVEAFKSEARGVVQVPNPYRWLEDLDSAETKAFVRNQASFTQSFVSKYAQRDELHTTMHAAWNYPSFSAPALQKDGYYYFRFNSGDQDHSPIYRVKRGDEMKALKPDPAHNDKPVPGGDLFFDSNLLSTDGSAGLRNNNFSPSGMFMAYGVSIAGADAVTIYVRRTDSPHPKSADDGGIRGQDPGRLPDVIRFVKFSEPMWVPDDSGFLYQRYPEKNSTTGSDLNAMLYYHKLGDLQEKDTLIMKDPENPGYRWWAEFTIDGEYLVLFTSSPAGDNTRVWVADRKSQALGPDMKWIKIVNNFDHSFDLVGNDGTRLYFSTTMDAPRKKMVVYDLTKPELGFRDLIPQDPTAVLSYWETFGKDKVAISYLQDVDSKLYIYDLTTGLQIKRIGQDLVGDCSDLNGKVGTDELFIVCTSFTNPSTIYRYLPDAPAGQELTIFRETVMKGINSSDFVSKQVFYNSKDGTRIPMFITHHKDFKQDGTAPALQYGYGGFMDIITPFFTGTYLTFVAHYGGVLAVPNIRGGGEYGEAWHEAGMLEHKQTVFDDFQWATKYLVANKYVAPSKVAILGTSNGGILVGACVNQAPELYGAAIAEVGVMDMLRYNRYTIGSSWTSEFGNPEDPAAFDWIYKYSPLENVKTNATYPAVLVVTADHDERVVPLHSFKFVAQLQHQLPNNPEPLMLRVTVEAGHGGASKQADRIQEAVDEITFVAMNMGLEWR